MGCKSGGLSGVSLWVFRIITWIDQLYSQVLDEEELSENVNQREIIVELTRVSMIAHIHIHTEIFSSAESKFSRKRCRYVI